MLYPDHPTIDAVLRGGLFAVVGLTWVIALIRINGLRSLSKMTNFDFVMTIAMGSLLAAASQVTKWESLWQILTAMASMFIFQNIVARLRHRSKTLASAMQNEPVLLMKDGEICHEALKAERMTKSDLLAKLREANALDGSKVKAVILETTGDVSVLHGDQTVDDRLIANIRDLTK